ncbi:uncharacterized protein LOC108679814 [Hyalella azteca]|uniref:Uncharacterized protein LOC108679814 n=1 Tax=Hyalella azteca TaxID=294128 RepID=A0A8B7PEJ5_HYAAZ|nr:uncharacterized protein LOC108679814 [Hyalella azteca]
MQSDPCSDIPVPIPRSEICDEEKMCDEGRSPVKEELESKEELKLKDLSKHITSTQNYNAFADKEKGKDGVNKVSREEIKPSGDERLELLVKSGATGGPSIVIDNDDGDGNCDGTDGLSKTCPECKEGTMVRMGPCCGCCTCCRPFFSNHNVLKMLIKGLCSPYLLVAYGFIYCCCRGKRMCEKCGYKEK